MALSRETITLALSNPSVSKHIGPIGDVSIADSGRVTVEVVEDTPRRAPEPAREQAIRQCLLGLGVTDCELSRRLAVTGRHVSEGDPIPEVKNIILVMSGKGGVGKSTVAANLALALHRMGAAVGLLDADMYGPSVPTLFGVTSPPQSDGKKILTVERYGLSLMSIGFLLEDPKTAVIWRGPMLQGALMQFLGDVAWGKLDYLVLDLPPGTGDIALTLAQKVQSGGAVIVTTPEELALQDVYKAVAMNQKVHIGILGVVENQSYFLCPNCDTRHTLFGTGGGAKVAEMAGAPLLGQLPLHPRVRECSDAGTPIVEAEPDSGLAGAFFEVAERLALRIAEENAKATPAFAVDRSGGTNRHLPILR